MIPVPHHIHGVNLDIKDQVLAYWGKQGGAITVAKGLHFKIKKWGNGHNNSKTPTKRRTTYANKKLQ